MNDTNLCQVFTEQLSSLKELMTEKFERVLDNQGTMTERINTAKSDIKDLDGRIDDIEKSFVQLQTEKDTSIRNTRWLAVGIGVILAAIEIYILFKK